MREEIEQIIYKNKNLIYKIASKYSAYYSMEDLFQVGVIGIINAYKNYDNKKEAEFTTYAYKYILGEIVKFVSNDRTMKVNSEILKIYKCYEKSKDYLTNKLSRTPSFEEVCKFMGMDESVVKEAIEKSSFTVSLDANLGEDNFTLENTLGSDDRVAVDNIIDLQSELSRLPEQERKIIELRYYRDFTQSETAKILGYSQVQVSRFESKILKKIKTNIAA